MNGLDKIIEKINEECDKNCSRIDEKARKDAEEIQRARLDEAKLEAERITKKAKEQCNLTAEKAKSGSALLDKKIRLQIKNEIINGYIKKAKDALCGMPDKEYFDTAARLVKAYARKGEGTLKFSDKDLKRIPAGFENTLNSALSNGASVKISNEPIDTDGGFILEYEDIEENCTFTALIETNLDAIRDRLNSEIFG